MKHLILVVVLLGLLLTACGPSDELCNQAWDQMDVDPDDEAWIMSMIINKEQLPNTVGERLSKCLERGWRP